MNISFFLKTKADVSYLYDDCSVAEALQQLLATGFTAIPLIDRQGHYIGTISEGDFLRLLLRAPLAEVNTMNVGAVERRVRHRTVSIDARMADLVDLMTAQNFVPVADGRGMLIGIVTRHDMFEYLQGKRD